MSPTRPGWGKENEMSHEVETMAWAHEVPWHGLGVEVAPGTSPEDMMRLAGCWLRRRLWHPPAPLQDRTC